MKNRRRGPKVPFTSTHMTPDSRVNTRLDDLDWQPAGRGCVGADVHSKQAGEVCVEAGPTVSGRFQAAAYGFLGIILWEQRSFDTLKDAQLQAIACRNIDRPGGP